jgi:hypothetical protein
MHASKISNPTKELPIYPAQHPQSQLQQSHITQDLPLTCHAAQYGLSSLYPTCCNHTTVHLTCLM